jgi:hypothetical protein
MTLLYQLYHETSGTVGTFGTLFAPKTPETTLKSGFLQSFLAVFRPKTAHFRPKNDQKASLFIHFWLIFDRKIALLQLLPQKTCAKCFDLFHVWYIHFLHQLPQTHNIPNMQPFMKWQKGYRFVNAA